ncbi:hypothetical protein HELRODRAFT_180714 [Helobdella robusta]|uniref:Uncharacterized protein n=1 Tax=Helobdella robusta TaxID=6412 RepID=T1FG72_HELRO|nr:hypothetical protein HELRODRAFT_180714 [Helobdella robusta]ESN93623.1 hypothetical protein HELRODRAFT_180714 [Helobdella robusta]
MIAFEALRDLEATAKIFENSHLVSNQATLIRKCEQTITSFIELPINYSQCMQLFIASFFTCDEISVGKKILVSEYEMLKKDKIKQLNRGSNKYEKVCDIVDIFVELMDNKLSEQLPIFVIFNIERVPIRLAKDNSKMVCESLNKLNERLDNIEKNNQLFLKFMQSHSGVTKPQSGSDQVGNVSFNARETDVKQATKMSYLDTAKLNLPADNVAVDSNNSSPWMVVPNKVNKRKQDDANINNVNKRILKPTSLPIKKTVGKLCDTTGSLKLKGAEKKSVIYLGNITPCSKDTVAEHLRNFDIKFHNIFPAKQPQKNNAEKTNDNDEEYSSFRICIPEIEKDKIFNADIWPLHANVREWLFYTNLAPKTPSVDNG